MLKETAGSISWNQVFAGTWLGPFTNFWNFFLKDALLIKKLSYYIIFIPGHKSIFYINNLGNFNKRNDIFVIEEITTSVRYWDASSKTDSGVKKCHEKEFAIHVQKYMHKVIKHSCSTICTECTKCISMFLKLNK